MTLTSESLDLPAADDTAPDEFGAESFATPPERLGVRALCVDVVRLPGAAFRRLAEHPDRRWVFPVLALVTLSTAYAVALAINPGAQAYAHQVMMARLSASSSGMSQAQMAQITQSAGGTLQLVSVVGAFIGGLVATGLGLVIAAAIFHFLSTVMGGQQSYRQMFTVISWASLPLALGAAVRLVAVLAGNFDPNPAGLAGLVGGAIGAPPGLMAPLLGQIELWNLWSLALSVLAIQAVAQITRRKALVIVVVLVALQIAIGLAGTLISRALMGLSGSS
jgi:hypothetical protein